MNAILNTLEKYLKTDLRYIIGGGFWLTAGKVVAMSIAFISSVAFANLLPEETYGTYRYIISILVILALPTLSGIDTSVTRSIARGFDGSFKSGLITKSKWGALGGLMSAIIAIYYYYQGNTIFGHIFIISTVLMPLLNVSYLYLSVLSGKKDFRSMSLHLTASRIFVVIVMVTTIFNTSNLFFIFIAYFFSYSSTQIISSLIVWRNQINNDKTEPGVTSYGKHLSVMQGATVIANNIDKILLFQFTGPAILAGYYLALVPFKQIKNFLSALNVLALPKLSSQKVSDIKVNLPPKLIKSYLLIVPIVLSYIILAPFFFKILFPNYVDFVFISQLFSLMLLFTPTTLLNTALTALEFKKQLYIVSTSTAILRVLLLLIAVPLWGLTGAVSVVIISQTYTAICLVFLFWKIEPPEPTGAVLQ